jgi:hypothetical protein
MFYTEARKKDEDKGWLPPLPRLALRWSMDNQPIAAL